MNANQTNYVVGFLFRPDFSEVALILKQKPEFQRGLLNGIGGKVENGEDSHSAMKREFLEEATYPAPSELNWKHFCGMSGANNDGSSFGIDFFYAIGNPHWITSREIEQIGVYNTGAICAGDWKTLGNIPWLVALARDFGNGVHPPTNVQVNYSTHQ